MLPELFVLPDIDFRRDLGSMLDQCDQLEIHLGQVIYWGKFHV